MEKLFEQFPEWQSEIEQLYQEDADFQEMCQDYEEVRTLLATWTTSPEVNPSRIDALRTLLKELEAEITEALQTRFQPVEPPEQDSAFPPPPTGFTKQGGEEEDHPGTDS